MIIMHPVLKNKSFFFLQCAKSQYGYNLFKGANECHYQISNHLLKTFWHDPKLRCKVGTINTKPSLCFLKITHAC